MRVARLAPRDVALVSIWWDGLQYSPLTVVEPSPADGTARLHAKCVRRCKQDCDEVFVCILVVTTQVDRLLGC